LRLDTCGKYQKTEAFVDLNGKSISAWDIEEEIALSGEMVALWKFRLLAYIQTNIIASFESSVENVRRESMATVVSENTVEAILERWPEPEQHSEIAEDSPDTAMPVRKKTSRTVPPEDEAMLVSRINSVLVSARRRFPDQSKRPSFRDMAQAMVREKLAHGFGEVAVRQILMGNYRPAVDRQIPGLSRG
jgi:hypothetical protein